jgi:alpha-L-fucosidase
VRTLFYIPFICFTLITWYGYYIFAIRNTDSAKDIRFTTKGKTIYAITLGWPEDDLLIKSFAEDTLPSAVKIKQVSLVGCNQELKWDLKNEGLFIKVPSEMTNSMAAVFKIETE